MKYSIGKFNFDSQKELNLTIKTMLSECKYNVEFENGLFAEVINSLHESVRRANLKVTKFKIIDYNNQINEWEWVRDRLRGGIYVLGFFEPIKKWHGVTLYPHKKKNVCQSLINALRQKWSEKAIKRQGQSCEKCFHPYPELHHSNITFKEIAEKSLKLFTDDEIKYGLGNDWWMHENEADALKNNHPAVIKMFELHKDVKYEWLCDTCHKGAHKKC